MKVLIWIGCFILQYIFAEIIDGLGSIILNTGIVAGYEEATLYSTIIALLKTALLGLAIWSARRLCKILDAHRQKKEDKQTQTEAVPDPQVKEQQESELANYIEIPRNERKILDMITSKRIAAVISILLCIILYLSFLSAFTTKRDTYICYTTKTGECFHSATCKYLNTAYETTVYEASQKYKVCKYCNPCIEQYETTITDRNYIIPIFISVPISAAVFFLLTYKKK